MDTQSEPMTVFQKLLLRSLLMVNNNLAAVVQSMGFYKRSETDDRSGGYPFVPELTQLRDDIEAACQDER